MKRRLIRELPQSEQPLYRLQAQGTEKLSLTELIAAILNTPDALDLAQELVQHFGLPQLFTATPTELTQVEGIGPKLASRLIASLEFGRRALSYQADCLKIKSPQDAAKYLQPLLSQREEEHFLVLLITYPDATIQQPTYQSAGIKNAWFAWYQEHARSTGQPIPERPQDVEKKTKKWAKQQLKEEAKSTLQETQIEIREENKQLFAYTQADMPLGIIDTKSSPDIKKGNCYTIRGAVVRNGSLRLAIANQ